MTVLAAIRVYPIKSFDGVEVSECRVLPNGALEHDRCLALFDGDGNLINGKRYPASHRIRAKFDLPNQTVALSADGHSPSQFHLVSQLDAMAEWFAEYFGTPVRVARNAEGGFPDDGEAPGPTVISSATLQVVAEWLPELSVADLNRRFRANLELEATEPFWEDRLFGAHGGVRFRIGDVEFWGTNPCARCAVPTRSPETGEVMASFARIVAERRKQTLPAWAAAERFDHFYRISVNTRLSQLGTAQLRVGDAVRVEP